MKPNDPFLFKSLQLARSSVSQGNHPFGAVLVHRNRIIAEAQNTVISDGDVTAHAEMNLIRAAVRAHPKRVLEESTLYASTEPCAMCCGAIYWACISTVIFGCSNRTLSQIVNGTLQMGCDEVLLRGQRGFKISGPIADSSFREIHESFWRVPENES